MENNDSIKLPPKQRKNKNSTKDELLQLNREELVERILQLEAHNAQLKNIISKNIAESEESDNKKRKQYDFSKCHHRRLLLKIMYFGWKYHGLAVQEDSTQTIEHNLFKALIKTCLIESREKSQYHRCGRTDKGVSAFGQVISITVRSKHPPDVQNLPESLSTEIEYCKILNRVLPKDIRAIAWMPIPDNWENYSARFDCKKRKYKYYFPKSSLNISAMRDGCSRLIGSHDFRNLCKMDVGNGVTQFKREILSANIVPINGEDEPTSMYALVIEGNAFLWHQIRCIMSVLLLIGAGKEEPSVINHLLNVEANERKPQYNMAIDVPLNLFECTYDLESTSNWIYTDELKSVIENLQNMWALQNIKATMIKDCIEHLENVYYNTIKSNQILQGTANCQSNDQESYSIMVYTDSLIQGVKPKKYVPLLKREVCSSLEERIEHFKKKRKIETNN